MGPGSPMTRSLSPPSSTVSPRGTRVRPARRTATTRHSSGSSSSLTRRPASDSATLPGISSMETYRSLRRKISRSCTSFEAPSQSSMNRSSSIRLASWASIRRCWLGSPAGLARKKTAWTPPALVSWLFNFLIKYCYVC